MSFSLFWDGLGGNGKGAYSDDDGWEDEDTSYGSWEGSEWVVVVFSLALALVQLLEVIFSEICLGILLFLND